MCLTLLIQLPAGVDDLLPEVFDSVVLGRISVLLGPRLLLAIFSDRIRASYST